MLRMVMAALIAGFPLGAEAADVTANQVIDGKNSDAVKVYAKGVGTGILAANTYLTHIRQKEMFCLPPGLALTPEQYIAAMEELIRKKPEGRDQPAPVVMVIALIDMFPCQ